MVKYVWKIVEGNGMLGGAGAAVIYRPPRDVAVRHPVTVECTVLRRGMASMRGVVTLTVYPN